MASIIEGYNYDIFISYRQKDNKGERWVSEFVESLKTELESTFKEEVSVYFDINPSDYLLETYEVDESLKEKLNCLVFIPVISRTYCDPKSFAWEHEFRAFVEQASNDTYGLKIKLPNGNVTSRVLPVRIYDLDAEDVKLCESVLGSVLRGIEFIYSEPGVNRPLKPGDPAERNLNKTNYRNQINKVGNAVKEIVQGVSAEVARKAKERDQITEPNAGGREDDKKINREIPAKQGRLKILTTFFIAAILLIAGIIFWPKIFKRDTRLPVTVIPFKNNSNDTLLNVWQEGIQTRLVEVLSNSAAHLNVKYNDLVPGYLKSKSLTSNASMTPSLAKIISKKLDVNILIEGGIMQEDSVLIFTALLRDSKKGDVIKSFEVKGRSDKKIQTSDTLSRKIRNYLLNYKKGKTISQADLNSWSIPYTISPEAFEYHIQGSKAYAKYEMSNAVKWFLKSLKADSTFFMEEYLLSAAYWGVNKDSSKYWCRKVYNKKAQLSPVDQLRVDFMYAKCFGTDFEAIEFIKQATDLVENNVIDMWLLGLNYSYTFQYKKCIEVCEKALKIYDEWDSKPFISSLYTLLIGSYHKLGQHKKEKGLYKRAEQDFPGMAGSIFYLQAVHSFAEKDTAEANRYIDKYVSFLRNRTVPATETYINNNLAYLYAEAGNLGEAEAKFRRCVFLEQKNKGWQNPLAYFLIDTERNIDEGLQILDNLLKIDSTNYTYLANKGYGLFKQKKYKEAYELLDRSWKLRMEKSVYDHQSWLRLEAARKAAEAL